ncbi:PREDICTED: pentatricopeptide repeat-containing protein At3g16610 [Nelumbo nucifera]|uniref:Pentatricopeptide repeat-containing protein At3g16610 n=2 Tax=Nelumbo nucifera TaxID=4432 RepID=A0A1U8B4L8_NELNU|nr:PREDICTED: pentatricopeptide repeat-containing protein At3g16610 [Nelumbo nucifera]XP_010270724.1 PREDICTED: pentatricopeptide repeat-containing protein At3g16610 [Nelumbo nucifera]XP_010270725.1 PREDICTED: pentatricopeptide repeat-containing protein At3g16610 [Nelumbo nucifera]XP_010270726.1 PREDICTED: pentatricopeptide repeat-containing protein At3g16610 [Nelumbo nucifera]XP_010270728.1 PREDICTED: pentatricopeptide repeat-containing protein At3g16610 [Nelumbo nucifera]DAD32507.1 TPA_asm: 
MTRITKRYVISQAFHAATPPKPVFSGTLSLVHFHGEGRASSNDSVLKSLSKETNIKEAIKILERSDNVGIGAYTRLLEACIRSKSLSGGEKIHQYLLKNNTHIRSSIVLEKLTRLYVECGEVELARNVFDRIPNPNVVLWNSMIRAYSWDGLFDRAVDLYYEMCDMGVEPNKFTFPFVLKACSVLKALEDGKKIHDHAKRIGLDFDIYVSTALVDLYSKCGCLNEAQIIFDKMPKRDVVAWNAMIAGSALHGLYKDTIGLFLEMQKAGTNPNTSTIVAVLPTVGQAKVLNQGKSMHCYCVRRTFDKDVQVGTAVLDMYAKCEQLDYARRIFNTMGVRTEVTWSAMIGGYVSCGCMGEALKMFDQMLLKDEMDPTPATLGIVLRACAKLTDIDRGRQIHGYTIKSGFLLDIMVGNSLLSMYAKSGLIDDAISLFNKMEAKDTVSYGAIISGCGQNGNAKEALFIFHKMQVSGAHPDLATMLGVLPACAHLAALKQGRSGHGYLIVHGFSSDTSIGNALIDMYSKCGRIDVAREVFDRIPKQDIVSWNAMIAGYGINGLGMEALRLFHDLQKVGIKPDDVTFVCILSACSHSGLITEGKHLFYAMNKDFNIIPRMEHYICMVDLLGRGGFLDEAHNFIQRMPFEPDVQVWGALLGACRIHGNIELGEVVSKNIQRLGPEGTGNFVLLSNIYSAAGRWVDAAHVRIVQKDWGFKKSPGCSWVEVSGSVHAFIGGDHSHPQSALIYEKLEELLVEMKKLGYHADASFVFQDVEEEEKERILLYHSEKLAIAFAILSLSPNKTIFVTKNLRVCGDCHSAIKFITMVTKRVISVRDTSRFHHFKDGTCNCRDFW